MARAVWEVAVPSNENESTPRVRESIQYLQGAGEENDEEKVGRRW
jgi:hypothetical protein